MLVLENEELRVAVALDRGAEIVEFRVKALDLDPLLRMPRGIRHPAVQQPSIPGATGSFLDLYAGGWREIAPNGGPPVTYKGAELGQHGELALLPWDAEVSDEG